MMKNVATWVWVGVVLLLPVELALSADPTGTVKAEKAVKVTLTKVVLNLTLDEALRYVEKASGVKVTADWAVLRVCGVKADKAVSIKADKATISQLLDLILARASAKVQPLAWYIQDNAIQVTSQVHAMHRSIAPTTRLTPGAVAARGSKPAAAGLTSSSRGLDMEEIPLSDVIQYVRDRSGVSMYVNWRALALSGVEKSTPVTLKLRNITLARTLDVLCDDLSGGKGMLESIYWVLDRGVLTITTGSALDTELTTRVIDVGDLLVVVPNFRAPRMDLSPEDQQRRQGGLTGSSTGGGGGDGGFFDDEGGRGGGRGGRDDGSSEEERPESRERLRKTLVEIVKQSIGEEMWQPTGKGSIKMLGSKMIISQTKLGFRLLQKSGALR